MPTAAPQRPKKTKHRPNMKEFTVAFLIVFAIAVFVFYPIAVIWSLNTLFGLTIPFTFNTWCAAFIVVGIFNVKFLQKNK